MIGHWLKLIASILIDLKLDFGFFIKYIFETSKIQLAFELFVFSAFEKKTLMKLLINGKCNAHVKTTERYYCFEKKRTVKKRRNAKVKSF